MGGVKWRSRHPLAKVRRPLPVFVAIVVVVGAAFGGFILIEEELEHAEAPGGLTTLQLAFTEERARKVVAGWDEGDRDLARFRIAADYPYLVLYSMGATLAVLWAARSLHGLGHRRMASLAGAAAWLPWLAGGADALENIGLLVMLDGVPETPWPEVTTGMALVKFAAMGIAGLAVVVAAALVGVVRSRA
jgi:hypothetical protein